jgi:CRP-like cAMP-binding protein
VTGRTVIGEYSILTNRPAITSYKAIDEVNAIAIPARPFLNLLEAYFPDLQIDMIARATARHMQAKELISKTL